MRFAKFVRIAGLAVCIAFLIVGTGHATEPVSMSSDSAGSEALLLSPSCPVPLKDFCVIACDSIAGNSSEYLLSFQLSPLVLFALHRGSLVFEFPDGFDFSLLDSIKISDGRPHFSFRVHHYEVDGNLLTIFLRVRHGNDGPRPDSATATWPVTVELRLKVIGNSTVATDYHLTGLALSKRGRLIAGPTPSEEFAVVPAELASLALVIEPDQVVGHPLLGSAGITLFDRFGNRRTNHDLQSEPILLTIDQGLLTPNLIDQSAHLNEGAVDLLPLGVMYQGNSAVAMINAVVGDIISEPAEVSFSGYDIIAVIDAAGQPVSQVCSYQTNPVRVVVQNNGRHRADREPTITVVLLPGDDTVTATFQPDSHGAVDTVDLDLPAVDASLTDVVLSVELSAGYTISGRVLTTSDHREITAAVVTAPSFEVVAGSFVTDTVWPGELFALSFDVAADAFTGPIDQTALKLTVVNPYGDDVVFFDGTVNFDSFDGSVIKYRDLSIQFADPNGLRPGWYPVEMDYRLTSGSQQFQLTTPFADSLFLQVNVELSYVDSSLSPTIVYAGEPSSFEFLLQLDNDFPLGIIIEQTRFRLDGDGFAVATNLAGAIDSLYPGANLMETETVFIPADQLGVDLRASATLYLTVPGTGDTVVFETDFSGETLSVVTPPEVKIIQVEVVAPNAPKVNTGQQFQIECRLANLTAAAIGPFDLYLSTNGSSLFDPILEVVGIDPYDTLTARFDVEASPVPNAAEIFRVSIPSLPVTQEQPLDDFALVTIQTPARLELTYALHGVTDGLVGQGDDFDLTMELHNTGQAGVSAGTFRLTTGGVDFGIEDPLIGTIEAGLYKIFLFRAPLVDTTATFVFTLIDLPVDSNTNLPAILFDTSFAFTLQVASLAADLYVSPEVTGSNLIFPGSSKELFSLRLANRGGSSVAAIRVEEIEIVFRSGTGALLDVGQMVDPVKTGCYEQDQLVTTSSADGAVLRMVFSDFVIEPLQERTIAFVATFTTTVPSSFRIELERHHITARFADGPAAGQPVAVTSPDGREQLISRIYSTRGAGLQESFVMENNPFHPEHGSLRFAYELLELSPVEFRIFTLSGEEVYSQDLPAGGPGATPGENEVTWDGRNDAGYEVLNGVYVAVVKLVRTGETARTKVAVVR